MLQQNSAIDLFNDSKVSQVLNNEVLLSSQNANWSSDVHFTYFRAYPHEELPECHIQQHALIIYPDKRVVSSRSERRMDGRYCQEKLGVGHVVIVPANVPKWCYTDKAHDYMVLSLTPSLLANTVQESVNRDRVELMPHFAQSDPFIHQIGMALKTELETSGFGGALFVESLITALTLHLLRSYAVHKPTVQEYTNGLPTHLLDQALEYIHTHYDQNIKLSELASALGISQYYFCHLFKQSMGVAPYQYLIQYRVEQAKRALKRQKTSITHVALECGFANSSHFAKHFKRLVGVSPKRFING